MIKRKSIVIAQETIYPGELRCVRLSLAMLYTSASLEIPVYVFHGEKPGPILFITAAIHGDEINGVEILRRLHQRLNVKQLCGTLITIPLVNVYGFFLRSRYLPDRRDLNRQFPGRAKGSMASKLANLIMNEIVCHSTHGIDLHTGALHRSNYPQIRFSHQCAQSEKLAQAFAAPILVPSNLRDGSLREATDNLNIPMIVYEAGEALRFDESSIRIGVRGVVNVMQLLEMLPNQSKPFPVNQTIKPAAIAQSTVWVRATESGMIIKCKRLGKYIQENESLCVIVDPLGNNQTEILSPCSGVIIGESTIPLVNEGDAMFHIAVLPPSEIT